MFDIQYQRFAFNGLTFNNNQWTSSSAFVVAESSLFMSEATFSGSGKINQKMCKDNYI